MAVSSCRRPRLRYSMTLASPCICASLTECAVARPAIWNCSKPCAKCLWGQGDFSNPSDQDDDYQTLNCAVGRLRLGTVLSARAARAGGAAGSRDRLVHDPADGARATSALGAAAETAANLTHGTRR